MIINVKDKDTMAIDDDLGYVEIEWMECFDNPSIYIYIFNLIAYQNILCIIKY